MSEDDLLVDDEDVVETDDDELDDDDDVDFEDEVEIDDTEDIDDDVDDDDDTAEESETEALEELEAEELELLDDEAAEALLVDEVAELRAIRREELTMNVIAQGARGDEFVCASCFLVKRTSQLANKRRQLCADCAS